jgi:hypothetical protein
MLDKNEMIVMPLIICCNEQTSLLLSFQAYNDVVLNADFNQHIRKLQLQSNNFLTEFTTSRVNWSTTVQGFSRTVLRSVTMLDLFSRE